MVCDAVGELLNVEDVIGAEVDVAVRLEDIVREDVNVADELILIPFENVGVFENVPICDGEYVRVEVKLALTPCVREAVILDVLVPVPVFVDENDFDAMTDAETDDDRLTEIV
jgi:hypothetical protein